MKISRLLILTSLIFTACSKDAVEITNGNYIGSFTSKNSVNTQTVNEVELILKNDNTYSFINKFSGNTPAENALLYIIDGSGRYTINSDRTISFTDTLIRNLPAIYPYYIQGKYSYAIDNNTLFINNIESSNSTYSYNFILKKQ